MKDKIAIVGMGMVGGAVAKIFDNPIIYDPPKGIGSVEELNEADIVFVCVPTPYVKGKGCDTSLVEETLSLLKPKMVKDIAPESHEDLEIPQAKIVVIKSTVIPGTTDKLQGKFPQHKILFNPEFLTESTADQDMKFPERQIIGTTPNSYNVARKIMKLLPLAQEEYIVPAFIAEFAKYACNTWFATKVAKNNELYDIYCAYRGSGEGFDKVIDCVSGDKRIGRSHLQIFHKGSRGYGGKCLPKDMKAYLEFADHLLVEAPISKAVDKYNDKLSPNK